jgi:hypothetical protein
MPVMRKHLARDASTTKDVPCNWVQLTGINLLLTHVDVGELTPTEAVIYIYKHA